MPRWLRRAGFINVILNYRNSEQRCTSFREQWVTEVIYHRDVALARCFFSGKSGRRMPLSDIQIGDVVLPVRARMIHEVE